MHHSLSTGNLRVTWGISNSGSQLLELCRQSGGGEHWGRVTTANCTLLQLHSHPQPAVSVLHSANSLYLGFSFDRHSLPRRRTVSLNRGEDSRDQTEQLRDCHRASGACCLSIWLSLLHSSGKWRRKHPLKDSLEMCIKKLHRITEAEKSVFSLAFCLRVHPQKWHQPSLETESITLFSEADVLTT